MPTVLVYSVDFSHGNLVPSLDTKGWGAMQIGNSGPAFYPEHFSDAHGLTLSIYRAPTTAPNQDASHTVYVLPGPNVLPVATRLLLHAEFDRPWAQQNYAPLSPVNHPSSQPNTTPAGSPWAVGVGAKFGGVNDAPSDKRISATCQFNAAVNGVRLNTPDNAQRDPATPLESPLDYSKFWPGSANSVFTLEHTFCGVRSAAPPAGIGYSVGSGALEIGQKNDERVFSNETFSAAGAQTWIDALGIGLATVTGVGQIMIRLRNFSVSIWQ